MISINDFIQLQKLKNKATSKKKIYEVPSSIGLNKVGIHLQDGPISSDIGIVNLHPSKATHWVVYINDNYFDSYGCSPPQNLSIF